MWSMEPRLFRGGGATVTILSHLSGLILERMHRDGHDQSEP